MTVTVYSKPACQFCDKAKALLTQLGHEVHREGCY